MLKIIVSVFGQADDIDVAVYLFVSCVRAVLQVITLLTLIDLLLFTFADVTPPSRSCHAITQELCIVAAFNLISIKLMHAYVFRSSPWYSVLSLLVISNSVDVSRILNHESYQLT